MAAAATCKLFHNQSALANLYGLASDTLKCTHTHPETQLLSHVLIETQFCHGCWEKKKRKEEEYGRITPLDKASGRKMKPMEAINMVNSVAKHNTKMAWEEKAGEKELFFRGGCGKSTGSNTLLVMFQFIKAGS